MQGLGVPTGEIEVFVCTGHVGELRFRHMKMGKLGCRRERPRSRDEGGGRGGLAGVDAVDEEVEDGG